MNSPRRLSEDDLHTLFQEAFTLQERNRLLDAEKKYLLILSNVGGAWLVHYNLGLLYFDLGRFDDSIAHYKQALTLNGDDPDILFNLAVCLKQCGRYNEAVVCYNSALEIDPDDIDCLYNLAGCHLAAGNHAEASESYSRLLAGKPDHEHALNNLAYLYHKNGDKGKALHFYSRLLEINPSHESAAHMCNALKGSSSTSAPSSYIREVFDQYSDHYEDSLINNLKYRLPDMLFDFTVAGSGTDRFGIMLDLGCGTGLSGEAFSQGCTSMDGIDISRNMLLKAEEKGLYRHLLCGEITVLLATPLPDKYHLVIAADVLAYFGELDTVFSLVADNVSDGGLFYFSVETAGDRIIDSFVLQESGRFAHSENYIRKTAENNGWFHIDSRALDLRKERDHWIKGKMYGFRLNRSIEHRGFLNQPA